MTSPTDEFNILLGYYDELLEVYNKSSETEKTKNQNKMLDITDLIDILRNIKNNYGNVSDNLRLVFADIIQLLLSVVNTLLRQLRAGCTYEKYVLSVGGSRLDSIVYNPDKVNFPETETCPVIPVLVPILNDDGTHKVTSSYDATNAVLKSSIDMDLIEPNILKDEYRKNSANVERIIQSIIKSIIKQDNITEFTMTGETSGEILSSNPSQPQPPSTFAYGAYKNLKNVITDRNIKLTLKIHNPTQAFKITHLINVPQTYSNCYAQKEPNYEKI